MYQLHYTLDTTIYNLTRAKYCYTSDTCKILEHYNINNRGLKFYELLTSENFEQFPVIPTLTNTVRIKLETNIKPDNFLYVEKHYKLNEFILPLTELCNEVMMAEVINPTSHKFVLTLRTKSYEDLLELESELSSSLNLVLSQFKSTTEYCIIDTNERLDYTQTELLSSLKALP